MVLHKPGDSWTQTVAYAPGAVDDKYSLAFQMIKHAQCTRAAGHCKDSIRFVAVRHTYRSNPIDILFIQERGLAVM